MNITDLMKRRSFLAFLFLMLTVSSMASAALDTPVRDIKIRAAVSSSFKKNPDWRKEITNRVSFANQIFEKKFAVHFTVGSFEAWEPADEKRETSLIIEELRALFPLAHEQIVIGFHKMTASFGQNEVLDPETVGTAQSFRGYVILRDPFQDLAANQRNLVLTHELAHLFGAVHVGGEPAVMNPVLAANAPLDLDAENSEIITLTRRVDFEKGIPSLSNQTVDKLIQFYEKLIRKNPHSDFYYHLGKFYEFRKQQARAIAVWEEALRQQFDNPWIHWELGRYYYENSRYDAAIQEIGSSIAFFILPSQKQERAMAFNFLGVAYYEKGNISDAIVTWLKGLSSDPDNPQLQGNLAAAYLSQGDLDKGIFELEKLTAKYPDDLNILSNLGVAYLMKKNAAKAAALFEEALGRQKVYESPDLAKILAAEKKKNEKPKTEDEKKKEQEKPEGPMQAISESSLRMNLGAAYLDLGQTEKAMNQLEKALRKQPFNPDILKNLAQGYLTQKEFEKAAKAAKDAVSFSPKPDAQLYSILAAASAQSGKTDEAIAAAREGIRYGDNTLKAMLYKNIGALQAQQGKFLEAEAELKNSLGINWNDADTHIKLGYVYADQGKKEDAKRSLQSALRIDPKREDAKKALAAIGA